MSYRVSRCLWGGRILAAVVLLSLVQAAGVLAQSTNRSGIEGKVTDETGAVLPGVTVTISSAALQAPELETVTDAEGRYRFATLPAGSYVINYRLQGFQSIRREGLQVAVGAVVTVDEKLKVGALEESVTVSGESPVVDIRTTNVATTVTAAMLDTLPTSRSIVETLRYTPGVRVTGAPDVGGSQLGVHENFTNYGVGGNNFITLDGVFTYGAFEYYDMGSLTEVQIKAVGNDAEVPVAGVNFVGILKSGGNEFHGDGLFQWESSHVQSSNVDSKLRAQGVTFGDSLDRYYDSNADLGGRIVPNRLWFYTGWHSQQRWTNVLGFVDGNGAPALSPLRITNFVAKLSGQLNSKQRLEGYFDHNNKHTFTNSASALRPLPSTADYTLPANTYKIEWTMSPTSRSFVNALFAQTGWLVGYANYTDAPSVFDVTTLRYSGAFTPATATTLLDYAPPAQAPSDNKQFRFGYSYTNSGKLGQHNLKAGFQTEFTYYNKSSSLRGEATGGKGNDYALFFSNGAPFEVLLFNTPSFAKSSMNDQGVYVKDDWRIGNKLTLNLGVRADHYRAFYPTQSKPAGPFSPAAEFPETTVYAGWLPAPRLGLSYAVTADNKTVLKATWGRYNYYRNAQSYQAANPSAFSAQIYRWADSNANGLFDSAELGTYVNTLGGASRALNPNYQLPHTREITAHIERELFSGFLARAGYIFKNEIDLYQTTNVLRPLSAYSIPLTATDPGPDGRVGTADDGGTLTYYDYSPAFAGPTFVKNMEVNTGFDNKYHNIEVVGQKRFSNRWQILTSFLATKSDAWIAGIPDTPNVLYPKDETWTKQLGISGSYSAPHGLQFSTTYDRRDGDVYARTVRLTAGLRQQSQVVMAVEPVGTERYPATNLVSARVSKQVRFGAQRLEIQCDLYNALNVNTALSKTIQSGPTFGQIITITPPRIAKFGVSYKF